jgi:hypothetical protein
MKLFTGKHQLLRVGSEHFAHGILKFTMRAAVPACGISASRHPSPACRRRFSSICFGSACPDVHLPIPADSQISLRAASTSPLSLLLQSRSSARALRPRNFFSQQRQNRGFQRRRWSFGPIARPRTVSANRPAPRSATASISTPAAAKSKTILSPTLKV